MELQSIKKLILWAEKNNISDAKIPRNQEGLLAQTFTIELNDSNLREIPSELFELQKKALSFDFSNNKIKELPDTITSSKCWLLYLCNNEIAEFPKNIYEIKSLSGLFLHGNKLTELPEGIDKIRKLKYLSISNNPIKKLPLSISKVDKLENLDIENTFIEEDSLEFLSLEILMRISFDDRLLPYFIKNFQRLKHIDTINLVHSERKIDDAIFSGLNLNIETKTWIKDEDYQGHGCIMFLNKSELEKKDEKELV